MYINEQFEGFYNSKDIINSGELDNRLRQIKGFYAEVNKKLDRCTSRYQDSVVFILNQFPVKITKGINGQYVYWVQGRKAESFEDIIKSLDSYIDKFESIRYLDFLREEKRHVVFVGANGCGKTTLLNKLRRDTGGAKIQYFSADRVLLIDDSFNPSRSYEKFIEDLEANYKYSINYEINSQGIYIAKQLDYYINLLERERYEEKEKGVLDGVTEKIICKWNDLIKERELFFEHGLAVKTIDGKKYPIKFLSSGEKAILYFLIGVLLLEEQNFYFIDEPENNLNPAVVSKLWNFLERERNKSIFVYLTHDSEFVSSRLNSKIYWIEKYDGKEWQWKELNENTNMPQNLMIQLVGNREPVLFCESQNEYKYDSQLFKMMFPEYKVVSSGGCDKVSARVKAYKELGLPHEVFGIIDCDYKTEDYLTGMENNKIYHMPFHEIENFLFCEKILKSMINKYSKAEDKAAVYENIKQKVKSLYVENKDKWIAKHVAFELKNKFDYQGKVNSLCNITEFKKMYQAERKSDEEIDEIAKKYECLYNDVIAADDYNLFLRHLDYKGLLSKFDNILKFDDSIEYKKEVLTFLNSVEGEQLLKELRGEYLPNMVTI